MICFYDGSLHQPFFFMGWGAFWFWKSGNLTAGTQLYLLEIRRKCVSRHSTYNCRPNTSKKNGRIILACEKLFGLGGPVNTMILFFLNPRIVLSFNSSKWGRCLNADYVDVGHSTGSFHWAFLT